jgi:hypothetical protein
MENRAAGRTVARTRLVSFARSIARGRTIEAGANCARGSAPVAYGWSFPSALVTAVAALTPRGFRFQATNASGAARAVRFFGVCLTTNAGPQETVPGFGLGAGPIEATGTFANGSGGCDVATSFTDRFVVHAPGDGKIRITQPRTGDDVRGRVERDGTVRIVGGRETYSGRIVEDRMTATYTYTTATGCVATYDAVFVLAL